MIDESLIMYIVIGCLLFSWFVYLVAGFKQGIIWGICMVIFFPFSNLLFTALHWDRAKTGFISLMIGIAVLLTFVGLNPEAVKKDNQAESNVAEPIEKELVEENTGSEETGEDNTEEIIVRSNDEELEAILKRREEEDRIRQQEDAELEKKRHERMQQSVESFGEKSKSVDWYE